MIDAFDAFLFDLDGVVWLEESVIEGAPETIAKLREAGKRVVFVTNNAARSARDFAAKLMKMRIPTPPGDVFTSAHACVEVLREIGLPRGSKVHVLGTDALLRVVSLAGYEATRETGDGVDALVAGWKPDLVYDDITRAADVGRSGVPFIAANRDATYPGDGRLLPGSGSILAAVETASGRKASLAGKPAPALFRMALARSGVPNDRALFVGDRSDSDVVGARAAQIPVVLVLTGVTRPEDVDTLPVSPDQVISSIGDLVVEPFAFSSAEASSPGIGSPAEGDDEHQAGNEPTDMSEKRHPARLFDAPPEAG